MHIIIVLPNYTLKIPLGDTIHVKELVRNLSKLARIDLVLANNIIASTHVPFFSKLLLGILGFTKAVFLIIKRKPDLIYTRDSTCTLAFPIAKLFRLPLVVEVNGLFIEEWKMAAKKKGIETRIKYFMGLFNERLYKYTDRLVAVTPEIKQTLVSTYKISAEKISVIENGANTELFRPINTAESRKKLNFNQSDNYICFVGNLVRWQGLEYLIEASPLVLKENSNTFFLIVGDGPDRQSLTALAERLGVSDKFIFTGTVPYEEVPIYISSSDICVTPKRPMKSGYSPLKLYEYMSCGKPVIASRLHGFEVLEKYGAGLLINPENSNEFANAMIKLIKDPQLRARMGENGRNHVTRNGSWESVAKKVLEVCQAAKHQ